MREAQSLAVSAVKRLSLAFGSVNEAAIGLADGTHPWQGSLRGCSEFQHQGVRNRWCPEEETAILTANC